MPPPHLPKVGKALYNQGSAKGSNSEGTGGNFHQLIKCYVCARDKPRDSYSKRQLLAYNSTIYNQYAPGGRTKTPARTTCKQCTAGQTTELTCIVCGETKSLKSFSNIQRRHPDKARCKKCIKMQRETTHDLEALDSDNYLSSEDEEKNDFDFDTSERIDKNSTLSRGWGSNTYAGSTTQASTTTSRLNQANLERASQPAAQSTSDGWETVNTRPPASNPDTYTYGSTSSRTPTIMNQSGASTPTTLRPPQQQGPTQADDDGWSDVSSIKKGAPTTTTKTESWQTAVTTQRQENVRKGGWARVDKIAKNNNSGKKNNDFDDAPWLGKNDAGGGGWNDQPQDLDAEYEEDPWAKRYK